ncbi:hypothetical protein FF098_016925 [Parvularcula flava]|uniref:Uncharacterized protein n=1 Tax=Aquisalinus luteolus TaxID=1566827 RepID=A0A8J3EVR9_9PROT|nr:hypothetical protein [Aquisalinus luteolus]NHK29593.1 hypothetical protein [Aquisalinus luteolus]GGI01471.1 hypothetical protein GCM10011355_32190 [Aquisalinus luteolus]
MIGSAKEEKLLALFQAVPADLLRGLYAALGKSVSGEKSASGDVDTILLRLIGDAAAGRGIELGNQEAMAEEIDSEEPLMLDADSEEAEDSDELSVFTPPRNAMHAFFLPFESLIIDPPRYAGRIDGYLCSTSLPGIWRMLNDEGSGAVIRDIWMRAELEGADQPEEYYRHITSEMHAAARVIVDNLWVRAREDKATRRALVSRLGGETGLGDFAELQKMLPLILSFQGEFNKVRPLIDQRLKANAGDIAAHIMDVHRARPSLATYLQFAILSNLEQPWQALWLHAALNEAAQEEGRQKPVSLIARHLLSVLDLQSDWLARRVTSEAGEASALDPFLGFSELLSGIIGKRSLLGGEELEDRLDDLVEAGSDMFEQLIETAAGSLEAVLRVRADDSDGDVPDLSWQTGSEEVRRLVRIGHDAAHFLQAGDMMAPLYGKSEVWRSLHRETVTFLDQYLGQVIRRLQSLSGPELEDYATRAAFLLPIAELLGSEGAKVSLQDALEQAKLAA